MLTFFNVQAANYNNRLAQEKAITIQQVLVHNTHFSRIQGRRNQKQISKIFIFINILSNCLGTILKTAEVQAISETQYGYELVNGSY